MHDPLRRSERYLRREIMSKRICLFLLLIGLAQAKDRPDYIKGTYLGNGPVPDGTYTNGIRCGSGLGPYTCTGSAGFNSLTFYYVRIEGGVWSLATVRQVVDTMMRRHEFTPMHLTREKPNLLDAMQPGTELLFRVEYHKKIGGTESDVYIPRADNPAKEDKFVGLFVPKVAAPVPAQPTDNIKALCDSHKLSPELEAQYCKPDAGVPKVPDVDANLKEVCKSGKLSPEWQAQYCTGVGAK